MDPGDQSSSPAGLLAAALFGRKAFYTELSDESPAEIEG